MALSHDVIVVGAGMAGLTCGTLLADAGLRVTVLEAGSAPGGRARSWFDPGVGCSVDIGPHVLLNKYANMLGLLDRLGTSAAVCWQTEELLTVLDKKRHIQIRGGGLPPPLHYLRNLHRVLRSVTLSQLLSNVPVAWKIMRSTPADILELDQQSGRDYLLRSGVHRDFIDWFWASASMALLNVPLEQCSAASLMRIFAQMLGHNDVAFGFPKVGLSDLYAWPAVRHIEARGGSVRLGERADGLCLENEQVVGVMSNGRVQKSASVVLALPPDALADLLPARHPLQPTARQFVGSPYVSTYLRFDRKITGKRFWARPWSPQEINTDFYDLSNIRPGLNDASIIATNIIWSHRVNEYSDVDIVRETLRDISDFTPETATASVVASSVHRIPMSVPCAFPGIESIRPAVKQPQGIVLAGDWVDTALPFCMEGAARAGALAAEEVLRHKGVTRRLAIAPPEVRGLPRLLRRG